ncbi:MAG: MFS transporter [Coriobacteriia bacterium]|nr:MFS transporter [Coriobacteriia bacterium]
MKKRAVYIINAVLIVASLALVLSSIGKEFPLPYKLSDAWQDPTLVAKDDKTVVVDKFSRRINVLDNEGKIIAQNSVSGTDFDVERITAVCINGDDIYIAGLNWSRDGTSVESEKIIKCNIYGENQAVVFDVGDKLKDGTWHITQLKYKNNLQFTLRDNYNVSTYKIENGETKLIDRTQIDTYVYDATYSENLHRYAITSYYGDLYSGNQLIKKQVHASNMSIDDQGNILFGNVSDLTVSDLAGKVYENALLDCNSNIVNIGEGADFSWFYSLKIIAKFAAFVYLCIVALFLIVRLIKHERKQVRKGRLGLATAGLSIIIAIILVSAYFTGFIHDNAYSSAFTDLQINANLCADNVDGDKIVSNSEKSGKNIFYSIFSYDDLSKEFTLTDSSSKFYQYGSKVDSDSYQALQDIYNNHDTQGIASDDNGYFIYAGAPFNGGVVVFCAYTSYIDANYMVDVFRIIMILIVICLLIFACIVEANNLGDVVRRYRKQLAKKSDIAYVNLVRPMSLFLASAMGADSVLAVLIARDLLGDVASDFMTALPITLAALGLMLGIMLFMKLERKFTAKSIFVVFSIMLILSYVATAYACVVCSFEAFATTKLISGFSAGVLRAELYSMAAKEKNEKKRYPLTQSIGRAAMPAQVIATLICGYLANVTDYYSIYVFAGLASLIFVVMGLIFIPKGSYFLGFIETENTTVKLKSNVRKLSFGQILKWLISPRMLVLIFFVIVPYAAVKGYKSYLFPLYSSSVGMDKLTISVIFALATMVTYIVIHPISELNGKLENRQKIINGLLALGFIFVLFLANSRIEWAIVVMFLSMIAGRTFGTPFRMLWMRMAEYNGHDVGQLQPVMYLIEEACNALQVVFFSIMLILGSGQACFVFGIFCLVSAIIFAAVSYNSPMHDSWKK